MDNKQEVRFSCLSFNILVDPLEADDRHHRDRLSWCCQGSWSCRFPERWPTFTLYGSNFTDLFYRLLHSVQVLKYHEAGFRSLRSFTACITNGIACTHSLRFAIDRFVLPTVRYAYSDHTFLLSNISPRKALFKLNWGSRVPFVWARPSNTTRTRQRCFLTDKLSFPAPFVLIPPHSWHIYNIFARKISSRATFFLMYTCEHRSDRYLRLM